MFGCLVVLLDVDELENEEQEDEEEEEEEEDEDGLHMVERGGDRGRY